MTRDNNLLGKFELSGIAPMPRGKPQIEVTFDVDANGIMTVTAADKQSGKSDKITITNDKGRLTKEQIDKMVKEAESFKKDDDLVREKMEMKNKIEGLIYSLKDVGRDSENKLSVEVKEKIQKTVDEVTTWLEGDRNIDELNAKYRELMTKSQELFSPGEASPTKGPVVSDVDLD